MRLSCLTFLVLFLWTVSAHAIPPCDKALPLSYGQSVSCSEGVLLPTSWAKACVECREVTLPKCLLDWKTEKLKLKADLRLAQQTVSSISSQNEKLIRDLEEALKVEPTPWYQHPGLWAGVGVIAGIAMTIGVVYAVDRR